MTLIKALYDVASSELIEVFDRIIGTNIHDLNLDDTYSVYNAFISASKREDVQVRHKITALLLSRLGDRLGELSTSNLCNLAHLIAQEGNVNSMNDLELAKFIMDRGHDMTHSDLYHALMAFNLAEDDETTRMLEEYCVGVELSPQVSSAILYYYGI